MVNLRLLLVALLAVVVFATANTAVAGDPTRPYEWRSGAVESGQTPVVEKLKLNQIIAFANQRYAIINGQRYQHDDLVNGYRITAIQSQRVRLQNGEKEIELTMFTPSIKRSSTEVGDNQ